MHFMHSLFESMTKSVLNALLWSLINIFIFVGCEQDKNTPPSARFEFFPSVVDTSTFVRFDGSATTDLETATELLLFRWDYNGDGKWDTEFIRTPFAIWQFQKTGTYHPIVEVLDQGGLISNYSSEVVVKLNFIRSSFVDSRDGTSYGMVLIDNRWWMADNLRFGTEIRKDSLPLDNGITEMFMQDSSDVDKNFYGGYYTWGELTNYMRDTGNGICPPGWHILSKKDQRSLQRFWFTGDGDYYFKPGGYVGLDLVLGGFFSMIDKNFYGIGGGGRNGGYLWFSDYLYESGLVENYLSSFGNNYLMVQLAESTDPASVPQLWKAEWGSKMDFKRLAFNVRCVKDND